MVRVRVLRNGSDVPVPIAEVVVGDVVHLETGDKVNSTATQTLSSAPYFTLSMLNPSLAPHMPSHDSVVVHCRVLLFDPPPGHRGRRVHLWQQCED